jgi:hypothetical protein
MRQWAEFKSSLLFVRLYSHHDLLPDLRRLDRPCELVPILMICPDCQALLPHDLPHVQAHAQGCTGNSVENFLDRYAAMTNSIERMVQAGGLSGCRSADNTCRTCDGFCGCHAR